MGNYLLKILKKMGFGGELFSYIKSFLMNRKGKTYINNTYSKTVNMSHGLPQGSPLSPLLFNLYINHLLTNIKNVKVKAFADDIIIYMVDKNQNNIEKVINNELLKLYKKSLSMNMFFSKQKCKFMTITGKKNIKINIKLNKFVLQEVSNIKYLGINFDNKIKFDQHAKDILKKSYKRLNIVRYLANKIKGAKNSILVNILKTFIRPVLEYGYPILTCMTKSRLKKLEIFQHKALCIICHVNIRTCYNSLLQIFELLSIKNRYMYLFIKYREKIKYANKNNEVLSFIEEKKNDGLYFNKKLLSYQFKKFKTTKNDYNKNTALYIDTIDYAQKNNLSIKNVIKTMSNKNINMYVKLITGSFSLNYFLFKFKLKKTQFCEKCDKKAIEDIKHRLFYCEFYKKFRKKTLNSTKIKNKNLQLKFFLDKNKINMMIKFVRTMN